jgi:hypothetical protein
MSTPASLDWLGSAVPDGSIAESSAVNNDSNLSHLENANVSSTKANIVSICADSEVSSCAMLEIMPRPLP